MSGNTQKENKYLQKYTFQEEKPVFALPYGVGVAAGAGCNALIKSGAHLTDCVEDIAMRMRVDIQKTETALPLSADEAKAIAALRELGEAHLSEIAKKSGVPPFKAIAILASLEVKGLAVSIGGNCYACV